jgi:hypothetical protein
MRPVPASFRFEREVPHRHVVIGGPEEGPDVEPCPAVVAIEDEVTVIRVAWELDEIDLAHLARGGTLWLTTWGGLPVHKLEVQSP